MKRVCHLIVKKNWPGGVQLKSENASSNFAANLESGRG